MEKTKRQTMLWHCLPLVGLVIWGAFCLTNNLGYDEAYSASMVSQSWRKLFYTATVDDHSPFYYTMLKLCYHLFGGGTRFFSLKILSLAFMLGYLLLGKYYVDKLFGRRISIYFMLFSILMPIMSVQAGNVRMYAAALFFLTLTGLSAYDIYQNDSRRKWAVFCAASLCAVYCHTFAMIQTFFLYLLFGGVLIYQKQYRKVKYFFRCGIIVAILYAPWLAVTCRQMIARMKYDTASAKERADVSSFVYYGKEWFSALERPIVPVIFLGMGLCLVLCCLAISWVRANRNYAPAAGMGVLLLTVLAGWLISVYINNCFMGRYAFPGFGFLMLFYAVGMSRIDGGAGKAGIRLCILGVAVFCFAAQYRSELLLEYDKGLESYERFWAQQVTESDVMIGPFAHTIFLNVYHPQLQYYLVGYKLYSLPFANTDAFTEWSQLEDVQGNIWYITFEGGTPDDMEAYYGYEEALRFHYMYYDFVIYRLFSL